MPWGQVVVGPPGSGKTTFCKGMQQFLVSIDRCVVAALQLLLSLLLLVAAAVTFCVDCVWGGMGVCTGTWWW